ncbi:NUDIX hydrolase [Paenibacillus qinlingensis]|uniref:Aminoglycoside 6'-N-acetyltransferase n=1 Tax=Paenibacillus qinlingensis TaxID=1837343 RepID=A0ABU1NRT3_9BACL|nr:NUDIX hydrolase [Paenibacillus qinlingensis]MDR6550185.1 aminoglycoside 6'-N-acetyltransferase [Paenibacillus qinlingensis]
MNKWIGSAGVCVNSERQLLMVLQGKPEEEKRWSVPSGGVELDETLEECCIREVYEETGYRCQIIQEIKRKSGTWGPISFDVTYFEIVIVGGQPSIHDPDGLIHEIAWKTSAQLEELPFSFPEDKAFLLSFMEQGSRT